MNEYFLRIVGELICIHSNQSSQMSRSVKDSLLALIFSIMDDHINKDPESTFLITKDITLYCYSQKKFKTLEDISKYEHKEIFLCSSLESDAFNYQNLIFSDRYKYLYEFNLKDNRYGIFINEILSKFSEKEKESFFHQGFIHENEKEVLIRLSDIDMNTLKETVLK